MASPRASSPRSIGSKKATDLRRSLLSRSKTGALDVGPDDTDVMLAHDTPIVSGLKKHQILMEHRDLLSQETPRTVLGQLVLQQNAPDAPVGGSQARPVADTPPSPPRSLRFRSSSRLARSTPRLSPTPRSEAAASPLLSSFSSLGDENVRPVRSQRRTTARRSTRFSQKLPPDSTSGSERSLEGSLSDFERTQAKVVRLRGGRPARVVAPPSFPGASQPDEADSLGEAPSTNETVAPQVIRGRRRGAVMERENAFEGVLASQTPAATEELVEIEDLVENEEELPSAIDGEGVGLVPGSPYSPNVLTSTKMLIHTLHEASEVGSSGSNMNSLQVEEGGASSSHVRAVRQPVRSRRDWALADAFAGIVAAPREPLEPHKSGVSDVQTRSARHHTDRLEDGSLLNGEQVPLHASGLNGSAAGVAGFDTGDQVSRKFTRSARRSTLEPPKSWASLNPSGLEPSATGASASAPQAGEDGPDIRHALQIMVDQMVADRTFVSQVTNLDTRESSNPVFKKPAPPKVPGATTRKRSYTPDPQQLFSRQEVKFQFQRFSKQKLTSKCLPRLMDISERFSQKLIKRLNRRLGDRRSLCLADMKGVMQEFGFLPNEDTYNSNLYGLLQDMLPRTEADLVVPYSVWNGKPAQGTMSQTDWDEVPSSKSRPRPKRPRQ